MIPILCLKEGCTKLVPALAICKRANRPRVSGTASFGNIRSLRLYWPRGEAGADGTLRTGHGACRTIS